MGDTEMYQRMFGALYRRERQRSLRAMGRCEDCGKRVADGKPRCPRCAERNVEAGRKRRDNLKAAGLCVRCGRREPRQGKQTCVDCGEYARLRAAEYNRKRREERKRHDDSVDGAVDPGRIDSGGGN